MPSALPIAVFTDGACERNPGPGGWAAVLRHGTREKELSGGFRRTTNNRMELLAVIEALGALKGTGHRVEVCSDSRYVTESVSKGWLRSWALKGFKKGTGTRENTDLWQRLLPLLQKHTVSFKWIRGHQGHEENERCDVLAVAARSQPNLPADVGFESSEAMKSPTETGWAFS